MSEAYDAETVERFWSKVDKNGPVPAHMPHLGPCWVWTGGKNKQGYGRINIGGTVRLAHRVAWEENRGPIPDGHGVLHHCDNPACVNYERHLFTGTRADNSRDMASKGRSGALVHPETLAMGDRNGRRLHPERYPRGDRHPFRATPEVVPRGERHGMAKLTERDVRNIRAAAASGESQRAIAIRYHVDRSTIGLIVRRIHWKHVTEAAQ